MNNSILIGLKSIGSGLATIGVAGAGVGIGLVFAVYITVVGKNPEMEKTLFPNSILGIFFIILILFQTYQNTISSGVLGIVRDALNAQSHTLFFVSFILLKTFKNRIRSENIFKC